MTENPALMQADYSSENPERDWERFQDAMRHILTRPKEKIENLRLGKQHRSAEQQKEDLIASVSAEKETL